MRAFHGSRLSSLCPAPQQDHRSPADTVIYPVTRTGGDAILKQRRSSFKRLCPAEVPDRHLADRGKDARLRTQITKSVEPLFERHSAVSQFERTRSLFHPDKLIIINGQVNSMASIHLTCKSDRVKS